MPESNIPMESRFLTVMMQTQLAAYEGGHFEIIFALQARTL